MYSHAAAGCFEVRTEDPCIGFRNKKHWRGIRKQANKSRGKILAPKIRGKEKEQAGGGMPYLLPSE